MQFEFINGCYVSELCVSKRRAVKVKCDTGSPVCTLCIRDISDFLSVSCDTVSHYLETQDKVVYTTFSNGVVRLVPIYIRNVSLGGTHVPKFYAFVNVDAISCTNLIGTDFISACSFTHLNWSPGIDIDAFDDNIYGENFVRNCCGVPVHEILEIRKSSTVESKVSSLLSDCTR